ncbi:hypothetical protein LTR17_011862 [Elasticomyces elasticus]|nr:hypothetical protein LTR17_011862 [Elasticomyces elasticus]
MPHWVSMNRIPRSSLPYHTQPYVFDSYGSSIPQNRAKNTTVERPAEQKAPLLVKREKEVIPFVEVKNLNPNLTGLNEAVSRYNDVNDFLPLSNPNSEVLAQRAVLRTKVEGARAALIKAVAEIDSAMRDLGAAAVSDSSRLPFLNQHKHWYEQGDLLCTSMQMS